MDALAAKPLKTLATLPAPGQGITPERFAGLIRISDFAKIEAALELSAPSEDFRQSLTESFWAFYINSLPEAQIKVNRAVCKEALQRAADLSSELTELATSIWGSGDCAVVAALSEFVPVSIPSQSVRPLHRSGVGFVDVLNEFSLTTGCLADALPKDAGGNRQALAFDNLTSKLAGNYCVQRKIPLELWDAPTSSKEPFFWFMTAVVEALREVEKKLPAASFDLPKTPGALQMRLLRLARRQRAAGNSV
jgi:hypothetical protein